MRYQRSYGFVFAHPDWAMFIGYLVDVLDHIEQHSDEPYPAFDIDQIGRYLTRGLLPTVAHMVAALPVLILLAIGAGAMLLTGPANAGPTTTGKAVAAGALVLIVLVSLL